MRSTRPPRSLKAVLASLSLSCLILAGCGSGTSEPAKLKVGTVDIMRVMEGRTETASIRLDWASQAGETSMQISELSDPSEAMALEKEIQKRSIEWQKRMDAFIQESIDLVKIEAAELAKEHDLDIVVVDNSLSQTIQYRDGEDLTLEVQLKLQTRE